jgi:hypothetical protein
MCKPCLAHQFANVPQTQSPHQITMLEEEKITAYYGAGTLYATPERQEPLHVRAKIISATHEHEWEAAAWLALPRLPQGEHVVWQGCARLAAVWRCTLSMSAKLPGFRLHADGTSHST